MESLVRDEDILAQQESIAREIRESQPLVSHSAPCESLLDEFKGNEIFSAKALSVAKRFARFIKVRGDGNCMYRAMLVAILHKFAGGRRSEEFGRIVELIANSKDQLIDAGFPEFGIEDFWEQTVETFRWLQRSQANEEEVLERAGSQEVSDSLVVYARFLTSWVLQRDSDQYAPFLQAPYFSVSEFVRAEVDPWGREADYLQTAALSAFFSLRVQVIYIDSNPGDVTHVDFPTEAGDPEIFLLYRPGHYDILLK
jgi:ubiquitin thioesterase protein OTUB1